MHHKPPNAHQRALRVRSSVCYITGLLYKSGVPSNTSTNPWSKINGTIEWTDSYAKLVSYVASAPGVSPIVSTPSFNIPSDINVVVSSKLVRNKYTFLGLSVHDDYRIGLTTKNVSALDGTIDVTDCIVSTVVKSESTYEGSANGTMTSNLNKWYVEYDYCASGPVSYLYYFNINYR